MRKVICLLLSALLLFSGCQKNDKTGSGTQPLRGDFTLAMQTPESLDPLRAETESSALVFDLVYDSLVYVDREMRPVPYLAKSCSISDDGMTISFTLHDNVYWHDGAAFTAQDVEHTIGRIRAMGEECLYFDRLSYIESVTVADMLHFDLHLTRPHVTVLNLLDFPIVPCHRTDLDTTMVGTGQYRLESYTPQKNMTLRKNEGWALSAPPTMDTIYVKMATRAQDAANMVKIGEVTAVASSLRAIGGLGIGENMHITHYPTLEYEFIGFNLDSPFFSSYKTRAAVSCAINRTEIIEDAFLGYGQATCVPVPPTSYMYIGSENDSNKQNTENAKALLFAEGYNLTDGVMCRVREDETVQVLSPTLLINEENEERKKYAEIIKNNLAAVGIAVEVEAVPFSTYLERLASGDFDMYAGGCLFSADLSYDFLFGEGSAVQNGYASAEMRDALTSLRVQRSDDTIRAAFVAFQEVFLRDMPLSGICFLDGALVHAENLRGIEDPAASKLYRNIGKWYLE